MPHGSLTLYDRAAELEAWQERIESADDDERDGLSAEFSRVAESFVRKVDSFSNYLAHLEGIEALADAECKRLTARKQTARARRERLEAYAVTVMLDTHVEALEGDTNTLRLRKNPPSVAITNQDVIPAEFITEKVEFVTDKMKIKAALKAGRAIPGAELKQSVGLRRA